MAIVGVLAIDIKHEIRGYRIHSDRFQFERDGRGRTTTGEESIPDFTGPLELPDR